MTDIRHEPEVSSDRLDHRRGVVGVELPGSAAGSALEVSVFSLRQHVELLTARR